MNMDYLTPAVQYMLCLQVLGYNYFEEGQRNEWRTKLKQALNGILLANLEEEVSTERTLIQLSLK